MPSALVSRLGQRREIAEFKAVLNEAQNQILRPVDAESMAQALAESGGREFVEMVKDLTTALTNARKELEDANRRYERLTADLVRRGIGVDEGARTSQETEGPRGELPAETPSGEAKSAEDGLAEWEEWDRRFRSLLG